MDWDVELCCYDLSARFGSNDQMWSNARHKVISLSSQCKIRQCYREAAKYSSGVKRDNKTGLDVYIHAAHEGTEEAKRLTTSSFHLLIRRKSTPKN